MNQTQLANVLIKILGLSLCASRVTALVLALIGALQIGGVGYPIGPRHFAEYLVPVTISLVPIAIGVYFMVQSRRLAEKFFGNG